MAMKNQRSGKDAFTLESPQATPSVKAPPEPKVIIAYFKERLDALIHDERYEEAGELNHKIQTLKETLKTTRNPKPENPSLLSKFCHFI